MVGGAQAASHLLATSPCPKMSVTYVITKEDQRSRGDCSLSSKQGV